MCCFQLALWWGLSAFVSFAQFICLYASLNAHTIESVTSPHRINEKKSPLLIQAAVGISTTLPTMSVSHPDIPSSMQFPTLFCCFPVESV
ncbi:hypothetical protein DFS34DRAFT_604458 [Phlyctochytrium arcticum]|nr:hypothetical protein DFS34DRAFT_604458 [Phlyctochytrium arcticum]